MTRSEIITELKKYFDITELVCPDTYNAFKDTSWQFLDTEELHLLLVLRRDIFKAPMTINNYHNGGSFSQRGFRCNLCDLVKSKTLSGKIYLSAHATGAGMDADIKGITAAEARQKIKDNEALLPYPIRLEATTSGKPCTWLHFDKYDNGSGKMIVEFAG